jgi:hypothetical protein
MSGENIIGVVMDGVSMVNTVEEKNTLINESNPQFPFFLNKEEKNISSPLSLI